MNTPNKTGEFFARQLAQIAWELGLGTSHKAVVIEERCPFCDIALTLRQTWRGGQMVKLGGKTCRECCRGFV